jgi:hypothetical protein
MRKRRNEDRILMRKPIGKQSLERKRRWENNIKIVKLFCNWTLSIVLFFLKNPQRFGDWILSPSSGGTPLVNPAWTSPPSGLPSSQQK